MNAALNRVNQYTPYGNLTYSNTGLAGAQERARAAADAAQARYGGGPTPPSGAVRLGDDGFWRDGSGNFVAGADGEPARGNFIGAGGGGFDWQAEYDRAFNADPGRDQWSATVQLSPEQQRLYDLQTQARTTYGEAANQQLSKISGVLANPIDFSGLPTLDDGATSRARAEEALFGRLEPQLQQQRLSLETRLRNQGLAPGSEAWINALNDQNRADTDARLGVTAQGGAEQARAYGISSDIRQRALQELLTQRQVPLNEAAALLTGQQVQYPSFQSVPQVNVAPTDYLSAVGQQQAGQNAGYQAQVQNVNSNNQAAAGIASAAIMAAVAI